MRVTARVRAANLRYPYLPCSPSPVCSAIRYDAIQRWADGLMPHRHQPISPSRAPICHPATYAAPRARLLICFLEGSSASRRCTPPPDASPQRTHDPGVRGGIPGRPGASSLAIARPARVVDLSQGSHVRVIPQPPTARLAVPSPRLLIPLPQTTTHSATLLTP